MNFLEGKMAIKGRNKPRTSKPKMKTERKTVRPEGSGAGSIMKKIAPRILGAIRGPAQSLMPRDMPSAPPRRRTSDADKKTFTDLEQGADIKRKAAEVRKKKDPKNQSLRPKIRPKSIPLTTSLRPKKRPTKKSAEGGSLKSVPESNTGLKKLPTAVRNKMGYMQKGGSCKGMGKAVRGGNFSRNG